MGLLGQTALGGQRRYFSSDPRAATAVYLSRTDVGLASWERFALRSRFPDEQPLMVRGTGPRERVRRVCRAQHLEGPSRAVSRSKRLLGPSERAFAVVLGRFASLSQQQQQLFRPRAPSPSAAYLEADEGDRVPSWHVSRSVQRDCGLFYSSSFMRFDLWIACA